MIMYCLKDAALQKKLNQFSDGDFTLSMVEAIEKVNKIMEFDPNTQSLLIEFGKYVDQKHKMFSFRATPGTIMKIPAYNPHAWNDFPLVVPPKNVWMRCKCVRNSDNKVLLHVGVYKGGIRWEDSTGISFNNVVQYRPWED